MSHPQQMDWVRHVRSLHPDAFYKKRVLEIGSYNVNGSVRDLFLACDYTGVDVAPGRDVDVVSPGGAHQWLLGLTINPKSEAHCYDTIITTEALEHDVHWRATLGVAVDFLKRGGLLIITCAGSKRPEHGTRRTSPQDSLLLTDYYRGLDEVDLRGAMAVEDTFLVHEFGRCDWPSDTYFWGIKK